MKKRFLFSLFLIYIIFVFFASFYIFSFNFFKVSKIGNFTSVPYYKINDGKSGEMYIFKDSLKIYNVGDQIYFYNSYEANTKILEAKIIGVEKTNEKEVTYKVSEDRFVSSSYLIGKKNSAKVIPLLGYLERYLTSFLGYFTIVIAPLISLFAILSLMCIKKEVV